MGIPEGKRPVLLAYCRIDEPDAGNWRCWMCCTTVQWTT